MLRKYNFVENLQSQVRHAINFQNELSVRYLTWKWKKENFHVKMCLLMVILRKYYRRPYFIRISFLGFQFQFLGESFIEKVENHRKRMWENWSPFFKLILIYNLSLNGARLWMDFIVKIIRPQSPHATNRKFMRLFSLKPLNVPDRKWIHTKIRKHNV